MGQFRALSKKNWILWKRNWCGNIVELLVPILFIFFTIIMRNLIQIRHMPQKSYLNDTFYTRNYFGKQSTAYNQRENMYWKWCSKDKVVGLQPAGNPFVAVMAQQLKMAGYTVQEFQNDQAINSRIRDPQYGYDLPKFCFAINIIQSIKGGAYNYNLRFNQSIFGNSDGPATLLPLYQDGPLDIYKYSSYVYGGIIGITTWINNLILQQQTGSTNNVFQNIQGPIYQQAFDQDSIYANTKPNVPMLYLFPLLIIYLRLTSTMLTEKQKKIRQTMNIMGMNVFTYYFTWFIRYFITFFIVHFIGSLLYSSAFQMVSFIHAFAVWILFDIVVIIQSFFIQTFFTKSKIGVVIALLFFLLQFISSILASESDNPTEQVNMIVSIIPHSALILCFETFLYAQSTKIQISFTNSINNYKIIYAIIGSLINIVFWLALTWYFDQVFPNQFGSKKHPLFCCVNQKSQKQKRQRILEQQFSGILSLQKSGKGSDIEGVAQKFQVQQKQNKIIKIQNLHKEFNGQFLAVNNLSIKMYNDSIFVLLGHNGAGKTTTISMLTGMLQPTSGSIQVLGQTNMQTIRQKIGVCPQHDTLYDDLTVKEHLELFGTFRGLKSEELNNQVNKLIADVNLAEKKDQYSKNLSGGQKRRLSVAMAFAGRAKVIILDQPTSGMDTSARRYIWELLKSYKSDRIILLTTHFMDEADYLGDRIGIMAGGKLMCCGSGHYLKNKFGVGYNITFVKHSNNKSSEQIIKTVNKYVTSAVVLSNVSSEISMQLPMHEVSKFPELFNQIDSHLQNLGISTYGISITTLQQVFLKVGSSAAELNQQEIDASQNSDQNSLKQVNSSRKMISKIQSAQSLTSPLLKQKRKQESEQIIVEQKVERVEGVWNVFFLHFKTTIIKRLRVIRRDYKSFILQLLLPMFIIALALLIMTISFVTDLPKQQLTLQTYAKKASPLEIPIGAYDAKTLVNMQARLTARYGSAIKVTTDTSSMNNFQFDHNFLLPKKSSLNFLMGGIYFGPKRNVITDQIYEFTSVINTRAPTACIFLQTLAAETYINHLQNSNISITLGQNPFPRTANELKVNNTINGFMGALIFSIALSFKFASIISFIVKERQDRSKHQQIVSGMNIFSYWLGNFCFDYFMYLLLAVFSICMCLILDVKAFVQQSQTFLVTVIVFLLYGLAYIPLTYIISYLFKDYGNAQAGFYFFTFVSGGLLSTIMLVLRFIGGTAGNVGYYITWVLRFLPAFSFGQAMINIASIKLLSYNQLKSDKLYEVWDAKISLYPMLFLVGGTIVYTILVFVLQSVLNNENIMRFLTSQNKIEDTQTITDSDVIQMKQKAIQANPHDYQILTKNLRKVFILDSDKKHKVAVDNLSLAIEKGQVFGLLGVNGAGKTTTFKMLAGQITSTSGDSYFTGMKISQNLAKVRQNLGYCPQFDALIDNLTVREQLQMFYDLKSLSSQHKNRLVSQKIKQMDLQKYQNKLSGNLSGGNKRKLSVAMAMIGNPNIIFLDEPSTGMDPKARRFMWRIISRIASEKKQSTIILTTHSMQQAEALSTKLGIMVKGNFKCIGTPQHIKSKYGQGYEVQIKIVPCSKQQVKQYISKYKIESDTNVEQSQLETFLNRLEVSALIKNEISQAGSGNYIYNQLRTNQKIQTFQIIEFILLYNKIRLIQKFMQQKFGNCSIIQSFQTYIRFQVKAGMSVGKMFEVLQNGKQSIQIQSYSIKQATVQQIFNRFAQDVEGSELM